MGRSVYRTEGPGYPITDGGFRSQNRSLVTGESAGAVNLDHGRHDPGAVGLADLEPALDAAARRQAPGPQVARVVDRLVADQAGEEVRAMWTRELGVVLPDGGALYNGNPVPIPFCGYALAYPAAAFP